MTHHCDDSLRILVADRPGPARRALLEQLSAVDGVLVVGADGSPETLQRDVDELRPDVLVIDDRIREEWPDCGRGVELVVLSAADRRRCGELLRASLSRSSRRSRRTVSPR